MMVVSPTTTPVPWSMEKYFADGRAGIDVDARLRVGVLRHDARDHRHFLKIQLVRDAVDEDGNIPG